MHAFKTIIVGTDLTERGSFGVRAAARLADQIGAERLHIVHIVDLPLRSTVLGLPYALPANVVSSLSESLLQDADARLAKLEVPETKAEVTRESLFGIPTAEIEKAADKINADLILVTSRGLSGVSRFVLGSVSNALVRTAKVPVMVVREDEPEIGPFESVMAAIDLSSVSSEIVQHASAMARSAGGSLNVVSCFEHPMMLQSTSSQHPKEVFVDLEERHRNALKEIVDGAKGDTATKIEVVEKSPPSQVVIDLAQMVRPDLLVVGTSGRNAWSRMLIGSTATRVLAEAPCPVLVIPFNVED